MAPGPPTRREKQLKLAIKDRPTLAKASSAPVEEAAARLGPYLADGRWLGLNNRYLKRSVTAIMDDRKDPSKAKPRHLAEYLAAASVLHCSDGWGYLGRALASAFTGDGEASRHLAYYAELRAAISILSCHGIGIFLSDHVTLDESNRIRRIRGKGTHDMAWLALDFWSGTEAGADLVSSVIRPQGALLGDWVSAMNLGPGIQQLGRRWLRWWGFDLRRSFRDRDARNESSYRPTRIREPRAIDASAATSYGTEAWSAFEPLTAESFATIDLHILRLTLEETYAQRTGRPPSGDDYAKAVDRALENVLGETRSGLVGRFLLRQEQPHDLAILEEARRRDSELHDAYHLQVMARAGLLLRIAVGSARRMMHRAELAYGDISFWAERLSRDHGLCEPPDLASEPLNLWADVEDALESLAQKRASGADSDYVTLRERCADELAVLAGCERIVLWGLAA